MLVNQNKLRRTATMMSESVRLPKALQDFVNAAQWTFAKTMPEWPHEYIVRDQVDSELFGGRVGDVHQNRGRVGDIL